MKKILKLSAMIVAATFLICSGVYAATGAARGFSSTSNIVFYATPTVKMTVAAELKTGTIADEDDRTFTFNTTTSTNNEVWDLGDTGFVGNVIVYEFKFTNIDTATDAPDVGVKATVPPAVSGKISINEVAQIEGEEYPLELGDYTADGWLVAKGEVLIVTYTITLLSQAEDLEIEDFGFGFSMAQITA